MNIKIKLLLAAILTINLPAFAQEEVETDTETQAREYSFSAYEPYFGIRAYYFSDMTPVDAEGIDILDAKARIGLRYNNLLSHRLLFDSDARIVGHYRQTDPGDSYTETYLEIKRLMLQWESVFGSPYYSMNLGRDRLRDNRSWLLDDDMDYILLNYDSTLLDVSVSYSTWLWDGKFGEEQDSRDEDQSIESEDSHYINAEISYQWHYQNYISITYTNENYERPDDVFSSRINRPDDLISNSDMKWYTLSATGERHKKSTEWEYWAYLSMMDGEESLVFSEPDASADISRSLGWDIGLMGRFSNNKWGIAIAYAGSDTETKKNGAISYFRQPVIAKNKTSLFGKKRYRILGETLSPAMANLNISSFWLGYAFTNELWLEAGLHKYQQSQADQHRFFSRSYLRPNGVSDDIGLGLDFVLGGNAGHDNNLQFVMSGFRGGSAFDGVAADPNAFRVMVEYNAQW